MAYHNTILRQIVAFFPRHEFDALAKKHHHGQNFRSFNSPLKKLVFPDRFAKLAIVPLRVSCAISK